MVHFAPNVFVLKYLQKTQQLSPEVERETTDYLVQGTGGGGGCGEDGRGDCAGRGPHGRSSGAEREEGDERGHWVPGSGHCHQEPGVHTC